MDGKVAVVACLALAGCFSSTDGGAPSDGGSGEPVRLPGAEPARGDGAVPGYDASAPPPDAELPLPDAGHWDARVPGPGTGVRCLPYEPDGYVLSGSDEWEHAWDWDAPYEGGSWSDPRRATVLIDKSAEAEPGVAVSCTGTVIAEDLVLTAGSCFGGTELPPGVTAEDVARNTRVRFQGRLGGEWRGTHVVGLSELSLEPHDYAIARIAPVSMTPAVLGIYADTLSEQWTTLQFVECTLAADHHDLSYRDAVVPDMQIGPVAISDSGLGAPILDPSVGFVIGIVTDDPAGDGALGVSIPRLGDVSRTIRELGRL